MNETIFRIAAGLILVSAVSISGYFRRRADRESGERIARSADGPLFATIIRSAGLLLWLSPVAYIANPAWMAWAAAGLPDWARWLGAGLGVACVIGIYWLFSSIGRNITPTSATRAQHGLVTHGPYRWVRHPLYTIGSSFFIALGLVADNWFIALAGVLAFLVVALRTPKEEANLIQKFGDEYREYMRRTGRFLPKLF
jgi:protein-S-isoprenylcysteine O-methyltransferase Ste14